MGKIVDARFKHPTTFLINGPSQSGKSTYVDALLRNQRKFFDQPFDYIYVYIGTDSDQNPLFRDMVKDLSSSKVDCQLIELKKIYGDNVKTLCEKFPKELEKNLAAQCNQGKKGCVIFDDLMKELANCDVIMSLFTKFSSHLNVTVIFITQNLFHRGSARSDAATIYRNARNVVLFHTPNDASVVRNIASRLNVNSKTLHNILKSQRSLTIRNDFQLEHPALRLCANIFATTPIEHQTCYTID